MNEEWRTILGFEDRYEVSSTGKVYSLISGIELRPHVHRKGHLKVWLYDKDGNSRKYFVHRLVAIAFIPQLDETRIIVNHKDGNKVNNHLSNLEWVTMTENTQHYFRELRIPVGETEDKDF